MRPGAGRWNGGALAVFVVLVILLPLLVYAAFVQRGTKSSSEDRALAFEASQQESNVVDYFGRSRALTQILAKNPSFAAFYESPGSRGDKIRLQIRSVREANDALSHLETLFPEASARHASSMPRARERPGGKGSHRVDRQALTRRDGRFLLCTDVPAAIRPGLSIEAVCLPRHE